MMSPVHDFCEVPNCLLQDAVYASDQFRMFGFKIKKCPRTRSHDWTLCPFAHRGERACRRDPRQHHYEAVVCPNFRDSGDCPQGQLCPYAHGIFEYWLHPAKYRTRVCNSGSFCTRKVCFFAHTSLELRFEPDFGDIQPCMCRIRHSSAEAAAAMATEQGSEAAAVESDFLASLSGLKVAATEDMPWNVIKKMIAVDGSKDPV